MKSIVDIRSLGKKLGVATAVSVLLIGCQDLDQPEHYISRKPVTKMTVAAIGTLYHDNSVAAKDYLSKKSIMVNGLVSEIDDTNDGTGHFTVTVQDPDGGFVYMIRFACNSSLRKAADSLKQGKLCTLTGELNPRAKDGAIEFVASAIGDASPDPSSSKSN